MNLFTITLILLLQLIYLKQLFISYSTENESSELFKYFHSMRNQFYVDLGAYDPIYASNTAHLLGWNGLNLEANLKRYRNFVASRPTQINLNMAVTNTTGGFAKLVQYAEDSAASIDANYLKLNANPSVTPKEENVFQITLADLCHNYYPKRPKLMSIDIQGHGVVALRSNDWTNQKCLPEVIIVEHIQGEDENKVQKQFLESNGYSFQKSSQLNEIFVHKSLLQIYKKREQEGVKLLANMSVVYWFPLFQTIFQKIIPTFNIDFENFRHIDPRNCPIYIHFASQRTVSIQKIRNAGRFLMVSVRPILLLHYNPTRSKLYLGSHNYKISKTTLNVDIHQITMHLIEITYNKEKLNVYVVDHNVGQLDDLQILDKVYEQPCEKQENLSHEKIVEVDNYI